MTDLSFTDLTFFSTVTTPQGAFVLLGRRALIVGQLQNIINFATNLLKSSIA